MGLFTPKRREIEPVSTELDQEWFVSWASNIISSMHRNGRLEEHSELGVDANQDVAWTITKGSQIVQHFGRELITGNCDRQTLGLYEQYAGTDPLPWELAEVVAGAKTEPRWAPFVVENLRGRLDRFGELLVYPDRAQ